MKAIAIDGPAGAGKSTIARRAAAELGYIYVDTGALYRAIGYAAASSGMDTTDAPAVIALLPSLKVELTYRNGVQCVLLNGEDVSEKIRTPEMSMHASNVSAIPAVREFLFDLQQNLAKEHNVIMDGRDIGTVVLPFADVKIFLTASPEERAKRRYDELVAKGMDVVYEEILADVKQRDYNDSHRAIAPLKQAEDAILVDTTAYALEDSIALVLRTIAAKLEK